MDWYKHSDKDDVSYEKIIDILCESIQESPYSVDLYYDLYTTFKGDKAEIHSFAEYFGVQRKYKELLVAADKNYLNWIMATEKGTLESINDALAQLYELRSDNPYINLSDDITFLEQKKSRFEMLVPNSQKLECFCDSIRKMKFNSGIEPLWIEAEKGNTYAEEMISLYYMNLCRKNYGFMGEQSKIDSAVAELKPRAEKGNELAEFLIDLINNNINRTETIDFIKRIIKKGKPSAPLFYIGYFMYKYETLYGKFNRYKNIGLSKTDIINCILRSAASLFGPALEFLTELYKTDKEIWELDKNATINSSYYSELNDVYAKSRANEEIQSAIKESFDKKSVEIRAINNLPEYDCSGILLKIRKLVNYGKLYNTDFSEKINELLLKLDDVGKSITDISNVVFELKELQCNGCPQIETAIEAFSFKKLQLEFSSRCRCTNPFAFSPRVLDMINEARNGNAICQQFLLEMFCKSEFLEELRNLLNDGKSFAQKTADNLFVAVSYLFDKPELYPFDLFMRLKLNYLYADNIYEYIDTVKVFAENKKCVAGIFEYGNLLCNYGEKEKGLKILTEAVKLGYHKAIECLYDFFEENYCYPYDSLFFKLVFSQASPFGEKTEYNSTIYQQITSNIQNVIELITGEKSFLINGEAVFSHFLKDIWCKGKRVDDKKCFIGYIDESSDIKKQLKSSEKFFSVSSNEKSLFSYKIKIEYFSIATVLITDKKFYWNDNNDVLHACSYSDANIDKMFSVCGVNELAEMIIVTSSSLREYSPSLSINDLEKMAYCGHPLAICNLLSNKNYDISEDKKAHWLKVRDSWISKGKFFVVCPECQAERQVGDLFCPDCGTKIY